MWRVAEWTAEGWWLLETEAYEEELTLTWPWNNEHGESELKLQTAPFCKMISW